jgi:hypothetical protein
MSILTNSDRMYFIDPIQDASIEAKHLLVLDNQRQNLSWNNTVVPVKGKRWSGGRFWWVSEAGDYVTGAPLNYENQRGATVGLLEDGSFCVGTATSTDGRWVRIQNAKRSDLLVPAVDLEERNRVVYAPQWCKAAPWAGELMPVPTDSDAVAEAKLALAKEMWRQRNIARVLMTEGGARDWLTHLDDLREDGWSDVLPTPLFGAYVTGNVMVVDQYIGISEVGDSHKRSMIEALQAKSLDPRDMTRAYSVGVTFLVPSNASTEDEFSGLSHDFMERAARTYFGDYNVRLGDYQTKAVLRGTL